MPHARGQPAGTAGFKPAHRRRGAGGMPCFAVTSRPGRAGRGLGGRPAERLRPAPSSPARPPAGPAENPPGERGAETGGREGQAGARTGGARGSVPPARPARERAGAGGPGRERGTTGAIRAWVRLVSLETGFKVFIVRTRWTPSASRGAFVVRFQEPSSVLGWFFSFSQILFPLGLRRDPSEDTAGALTAALGLGFGAGTFPLQQPRP